MAVSKDEKWVTKEGLLQIEGWARDGLIDTQIAHNMGICRATLHIWRQKHPIMDQVVLLQSLKTLKFMHKTYIFPYIIEHLF